MMTHNERVLVNALKTMADLLIAGRGDEIEVSSREDLSAQLWNEVNNSAKLQKKIDELNLEKASLQRDYNDVHQDLQSAVLNLVVEKQRVEQLEAANAAYTTANKNQGVRIASLEDTLDTVFIVLLGLWKSVSIYVKTEDYMDGKDDAGVTLDAETAAMAEDWIADRFEVEGGGQRVRDMLVGELFSMYRSKEV